MRRRSANRSHGEARYELEAIDRSQTQRTQTRRAEQSKRRRTYAIMMMAFLALGVAAAPSLVSHSPIGRSMLTTAMADYGIDATAESIKVGWITPLSVTQLTLVGEQAETSVSVGQLQTGLTLIDLYQGKAVTGPIGVISLQDVSVDCSIKHNSTSIEQDLAQLLAAPSDSSAPIPEGSIEIQNLQVRATDQVAQATWELSQSTATVQLASERIEIDGSGVITQPGGGAGAIAAVVHYPLNSTTAQAPTEPVLIDIDTKTLPLSILSLVARRFPDSEFPADISGDCSGRAIVHLDEAGQPSVQLRQLEVRNLAARDSMSGRTLWQNSLMTVSGDSVWKQGRISMQKIAATTDFASLKMDGSFSDAMSFAGEGSNPLAWLDQVDATGTMTIDLPRLNAAFPGALPIREGADLTSGTITAQIEPLAPTAGTNALPQRRRHLLVQSSVINSTNRSKITRIAPMNLNAIVASDEATLAAERFELESPFANIGGHGDLGSGRAQMDINFGKLARILQPIVDIDAARFQGNVNGDIRWDSLTNGLWKMSGEATIRDLAIEISPGQVLEQSQLVSNLEIQGRWLESQSQHLRGANARSIQELTHGLLTVNANNLQTRVELVQSVNNLDRNQLIPVKIQAAGALTSVTQMLRPWVPTAFADANGNFDFSSRVAVSGEGRVVVQGVDSQLRKFQLPMGESIFEQELVKLHFDGKAFWPEQDVMIRSMSVTGDAASAAIEGEWIGGMTDIEVAWRAKLDRIQASSRSRVAEDPRKIRPDRAFVQNAGFRDESNRNLPQIASTQIAGEVIGNSIIVGDVAVLTIENELTGTDLAWIESATASTNKHIVWAESNLNLISDLVWNIPANHIDAKRLEMKSDWVATNLSGSLDWNNQTTNLQLTGPANLDMDRVSRRLTALTGTTIVAEGLHQTPLEILYAQNNQSATPSGSGDYAFTVKGNLGWETVDTAGMLFGPAQVPFRMTESTVTVSPSRIPVLGPSRLSPTQYGPQVPPLDYDPSQPYQPISASSVSENYTGGEILLSGDVHYRPEVWIDLQPGPIARNVQLTPDMTGKWLKYLAPIAADAARVEGLFGADLQEAKISIDNPKLSRIRGRMQIDQVRMNAGPLADQVIASARQLQSLAALGASKNPPRTGRTLITLPAQTIEFVVADGVVDHRALMMEIDRARVVTSGQVDFDGRLNLAAQIPLDSSWIGADLRGLEGQTMTLPIDGTLSRPSLDSAGVQKVVADFGRQAVQQAAENAASSFLQKQLGRGSQQIEENLNRGLKNLRFDKLFGN